MMKSHLVMGFAALLSLPMAYMSFAAIITERNDLNIFPPDYAKFVGTSSHPGISSCWIPYGTYTDGRGSTEYTRATSNLTGVVCSAFDGLIERQNYNWINMYYWWLLYLTNDSASYSDIEDIDEFLAPYLRTNNTTRILDILNTLDKRRYRYYKSGEYNSFYTDTFGEYPMLEQYLARETRDDKTWWGGEIEQYHSGIAPTYFGGRKLEAMVSAGGASIEPPISSEWTAAVPFMAADSNLWATVWPTYSALTNDIHFFPDLGEDCVKKYYREQLSQWMYRTYDSVWGWDIYGNPYYDLDYVPGRGYDLVEALVKIPLPYTMEDVLSADTGWKYEYPPVETNSYWNVVGDLGSFRCELVYDYGPNDKYYKGDGSDTNYYCEVWLSSGSDSAWIDVAVSQRGVGQVFYGWDYYHGEDSFTLWGDGYQPEPGPYTATITRLVDNRDDFTHWRNGTTRLDWKRLGIICQLERQMETTYEAISGTDKLPFLEMSADHYMEYRADDVFELDFPEAQYQGQNFTTNNLLAHLGWDLDSEHYSSDTNRLGWSTPTCRTPVPGTSNYAWSDTYWHEEVGFTVYSALEDFLVYLCCQVTNRISGDVEFVGYWPPSPGGSLYFSFPEFYASGTELVPSNTMNVVTSTGFNQTTSRETAVADESWYLEDGNSWATVYFVTPETLDISFTNDYVWAYATMSQDGSESYSNGCASVPQITFTAYGGGPFTNWMWHVSGVQGLPADNLCRMELTTDNGAEWTWEGYDGIGVSIFSTASGWETSFHCNFLNSDPLYISTGQHVQGAESSWTSPSVTATWTVGNYEREFYVGETMLEPYILSAGYSHTGLHPHQASASIEKSAHAVFTYASEETRNDTIDHIEGDGYGYRDLKWEKIYSLRRSELELVIGASGSNSQAFDMYPSQDGTFTWESIKNDGARSLRYFRMLQGATRNTLLDAQLARYNMLANLSGACKSRCEQLGGMPIGNVNDFGKLTRDDIGTFKNDLGNAVVHATLVLKSWYEYDEADPPDYGLFRIKGRVHWDGQRNEYVVDEIYYPSAPCVIGTCGWDVSISIPNTISNSYENARADGWQNPMRKVIWKFKNLRDPSMTR